MTSDVGKKSRSIAKQLAYGISALVVISASATAVVFAGLEQAALEQALIERQALSARQGAAALRHALALAAEELSHVAQHMDRNDRAAEQRVIDAERALTVFFTGRVLFVNGAGRCQVMAPQEDGCDVLDVRDQPWFQRAQRARGSFVGFGRDESAHIDLYMPLRDDDGFHGALRGEILVSREDLLGDEAVAGPRDLPRALALVAPGGEILFQEGESSLLNERWVAVEEGAHKVSAPSGDVVVARVPLGDTGASLLYVWRWQDLDTEVHVRRKLALGALLLLSLLSALGAWWVAGRMVRPILALARDVRAVTKENQTLPPPTGDDEIEQLRRDFGELIGELAEKTERAEKTRDELVELTETLEERVAERTRSLEETRDALVEAERLATLGRAGAALSHELRNALNGLSVGFDVLGSDLPPDAANTVRKELRREIARLRGLADTLLDFAANRRANRRNVRPEALLERCRALALDAAEDAEGQRGKEPMVIDLDIEGDAPIQVDGDLMQSTLSNLMLNSRAAGARRVQVRARQEGTAWKVRVDDDGDGVAPEVAEKLFTPFVSGRAQGVGLGLSVSRRFAEMHDGTLHLVEGTLGGACFELVIPNAYETSGQESEPTEGGGRTS